MSIELRHGTHTNYNGDAVEHNSTVTVFGIKKIWIDQRYDDKDSDEVFTIYLSEDNGTIHKLKVYTKDQNTEITLTPDADRRLNTIPQAARGSIVNLVVPNDAIDTPYRSDEVVKNTTPNN